MTVGTDHDRYRRALWWVISVLAALVALFFLYAMALPVWAAVTLASLLALVAYLGTHQWLVNRTLRPAAASPQQLLAHLFGATQQVEKQPTLIGPSLVSVLEMALPLHRVTLSNAALAASQIAADGALMQIAVPAWPAVPTVDRRSAESNPTSIVVRHAQRGQPRFTTEDVWLVEMIANHLCRTATLEQAAAQGRVEERRRLALDLHDDIGARLLTLIYRAPTPELEDYARHTLQNLKTLTRGLAAVNQPLSHALAEWKIDITQRLSAAHIDLTWTATHDIDVVLSFAQWSGLTRVMRELVSNVMSHAYAHRVDIQLTLTCGQLTLAVADDGIGREPQSWSHGLGLGGVRKRVRQLGGEVEWRDCAPRGIQCLVTIRQLSGGI